MPLKYDPYGRDKDKQVRSSAEKPEWNVDSLANYLRDIVAQIEANLQNQMLPTGEKLDTFITGLVSAMHRLLKHAPRKIRSPLREMIAKRFRLFWVFARNEKVRPTDPEELRSTLTGLIDALVQDFGATEESKRTVQLKPRKKRTPNHAS